MWHSRSSFCVFGTEYECEYYLCSDIWPNTKRNIIHVFNDRIWIKILYGLGNFAKYEYELDNSKLGSTQQWTQSNDALMMRWWCADDALMMHWWCTDDIQMIHGWFTESSFQKYTTCRVFLALCNMLFLSICVFVYLCICILYLCVWHMGI